MIERIGPLQLSGAHGLAFGDPAAMHVQIAREELLWCEPGQEHDALEWDDIARIEWVVPTSRIGPVPLIDPVATMAVGALGVVGLDTIDPRTLMVRITTTSGDEVEWRVTPHHLIGYSSRDVRVVAPFLEQLRGSPALRAQLATDPRATLAELRRRRG
ncbi:hypothetical protein OVN18_03915 [Microcella daejeonensis]|uniref:Uncharacterized protein n=1 Tax=Microcella daejeonensis TaxID=2994971 RepID=A0A9E8S9A8_9MICO|nr:hypothetical protein [Microcella daejeonensis]WAB82163.1 hypothetical protein OVN18_03915 [Microcella daejeonensis]